MEIQENKNGLKTEEISLIKAVNNYKRIGLTPVEATRLAQLEQILKTVSLNEREEEDYQKLQEKLENLLN